MDWRRSRESRSGRRQSTAANTYHRSWSFRPGPKGNAHRNVRRWPTPLSLLPARKSLRAQLAGRAFAATVAPGVPFRAVAEVAGVRMLDQQIDERFAAEFVSKREACRLVDPHERSVNHEAPLHAQIDRELHRLDGVVAAIRITGKIRLAHAADEMLHAAPIGERARKDKENEVAAG